MNRKLLIAYGLLILFILLGYLLVFNINKFADESRIRDYSDIKKENKLRVAVLNDVFCSGISDEENEKIYEFFRSLHHLKQRSLIGGPRSKSGPRRCPMWTWTYNR